MTLDISSYTKAIKQLEESLTYYDSDIAKKDEKLAVLLRAASIQAFEFTYELSYKMLKRYLEMTGSNPNEIDEMTFAEIIRTASEKGLLLSDLEAWRKYREERGITSHTYDEKKAEEIFSRIPAFLREAQYLHDQLQKRVEKA